MAPDQPSVGNACSGLSSRPCSVSSSSRVRSRQPTTIGSAGRRDVVAAVRAAVEVHDVRIGAVPGQDDDQRLVRRGVLLDMDLAGRDVDDVAGAAPPSRARCRSGPTCSGPSPRGCRSRSRNRRGGGCASSRRARSTRGPCTAGRPRPSAARSRWIAPCRHADPRSCAGRRGRCAWPSPDDRPLPSGHVRPRAGDPALSAVRCAVAARSAAPIVRRPGRPYRDLGQA